MSAHPPLDHTVLYDAECPFCTASAALLVAWDRDRRLRVADVCEHEAERLLPELTREQRAATWHLVGPARERWGGGLAGAPVLRLLPGGRPLARVAERFPGASERVYALVSEHRDKLAPLIPSAVRRRAEATLQERRQLQREPTAA